MPDIVQELGAVAGSATLVGLALLSVLHVSQARDVRQLRERAGRAPERSSYGRHAALALAGVLVIVFAGTRLTGGDERPAKAKAHHSKPKRRVAAVKPATVTVAVLNGTTVPGLAAALRDQAGAAGFKTGTIDTFTDQQLTESVVQYAPGHVAAAKAVGRIFAIREREPVTAGSRALAGDATVIVIAGADKAP